MIDVHKIASEAAASFGLSLKDDPTAWPNGDATLTVEIVQICTETANDNARSAIARAIGPVSENIATMMDIEVTADGMFADLDAIWRDNVTGLEIDLSPVAEAADWQARVDALRASIGRAVAAYRVPPPTVDELVAYAKTEPRIAHFAAPFEAGDNVIPDETEPESETVIWDDEPSDMDYTGQADWDEPAPAPQSPQNVQNSEPKGVPRFCALMAAAGVQDSDVAQVLGISKSFYSQIRNNKRPWPGLKPDQVARLRTELNSRRAAINFVTDALNEGHVTKPEGL